MSDPTLSRYLKFIRDHYLAIIRNTGKLSRAFTSSQEKSTASLESGKYSSFHLKKRCVGLKRDKIKKDNRGELSTKKYENSNLA
jgi:hypothetical protein